MHYVGMVGMIHIDTTHRYTSTLGTQAQIVDKAFCANIMTYYANRYFIQIKQSNLPVKHLKMVSANIDLNVSCCNTFSYTTNSF